MRRHASAWSVPRFVVVLSVALVSLVLLPVVAQAAPEHAFKTTITGSGTNALDMPRDVAIDQATGDIYVVDDDDFYTNTDGQGNNRVVKFDGAGNFILMFGRDVNVTTGGDICTAASGDTCGPGTQGTSPGMFAHAHFIAVDNSDSPSAGSVYVGELGSVATDSGVNAPTDPDSADRIQKFDSEGNLDQGWGDAAPLKNGSLVGAESENGPCNASSAVAQYGTGGLTVDSLGRLYYACGGNRAMRFAHDGSHQTQYSLGAGNQQAIGGNTTVFIAGGMAVDSTFHSYYLYFTGSGYLESNGVGKVNFDGKGLPGVISDPGNDNSGPIGINVDLGGNDIFLVQEGHQTQPGDLVGGGKVVTHYGPEGGAALNSFGSGQLNGARGLSINTFSDDVYVANTGAGNVAVFSANVPGVRTSTSTGLGQTEATLTGKVDPLGRGDITTCKFEYGTSQSYGLTAPCSPVPNFTEATDVTAPLSGLKKATTYHFRLVVGNANGENKSPDQVFSTTQPPSVNGVFASEVTANSAVLRASINPNSLNTTYQFEYGKTPAYGEVAPVPAGELKASANPSNVSAPVSGLTGVDYHFRLKATNALGTTTTPDQTFNFFPSACPNSRVRQQTRGAYLPDCRAYELVTPANANGILIIPEAPPVPLGANPSGRFGWVGLLGIAPDAGNPPNGLGDLYVSTRSSEGWKSRFVGLPASEQLSSGGPPGTGIIGGEPSDMRSNTELTRFLSWPRQVNGLGEESYSPFVVDNFGSVLERWPTNVEGVENGLTLFGDFRPSPDFSHYAFSSGNIAFAPGGLTSSPGSVYDNDIETGTVTVVSKTAQGGDIASGDGFIRIPAVSRDGSHILMSTSGPGGTRLYMTVDQTEHFDVSERQDGTNVGVRFEGMTADGSKVFFTSSEQITADDTDNRTDLFMWTEAGGGAVTRLSAGAGAGNASTCGSTNCSVEVVPAAERFGAAVGQPQPSTDFSFAQDAGDIYFYSAEVLTTDPRAELGQKNLYASRAGAVVFVATLSQSNPLTRLQVTPDGHAAAFITASKITTYENQATQQMYTFEPATGQLVCVSCNPSGNPPNGDVIGSQNGRFITDDGRSFFTTKDSLVPRDVNGLNDVYEYVEGRPQLITTGTGTVQNSSFFPVGLIGVSADGIDVFFGAYETFVGQDLNGTTLKYFTARTNGGFPLDPPPLPCAAADECHGPSSASTDPVRIGSGANIGSGNLSAAKKCPRGKVRKGGRCVKKRQKKRKSARGTSSRKGGEHRG